MLGTLNVKETINRCIRKTISDRFLWQKKNNKKKSIEMLLERGLPEWMCLSVLLRISFYYDKLKKPLFKLKEPLWNICLVPAAFVFDQMTWIDVACQLLVPGGELKKKSRTYFASRPVFLIKLLLRWLILVVTDEWNIFFFSKRFREKFQFISILLFFSILYCLYIFPFILLM